MPQKYFRKYLPTAQSVHEHRWLKHFGRVLHHHNLWHLHRRSVAGGVAVGAFAGLIPLPMQMIIAAILAIIFRVNLPVAVAMTWYTNPFTAVPLYYAAYRIGAHVTGDYIERMPYVPKFDFYDIGQWLAAVAHWSESLGKPLTVGVLVLGIMLAIIGYFLVRWLWRIWVIIQWRRRKLKRRHGLH